MTEPRELNTSHQPLATSHGGTGAAAAFLFAGGGTGGHIIPALAVARELRLRGAARAVAGGRWLVAGGIVSETVRSYKELRVWQGAMDLVESVYLLSAAFPLEENYGLKSQIRRAAVSIPSNIAEGQSRASTKEFLNHLSIAQASLAEVETQLEISVRLKYLSTDRVTAASATIQMIGKQLHALRAALEARK